MENKNLSYLHQNNKLPDFEIRNIIPQDASNFLQLQKYLDEETDFMLLYPKERDSSISLSKREYPIFFEMWKFIFSC